MEEKEEKQGSPFVRETARTWWEDLICKPARWRKPERWVRAASWHKEARRGEACLDATPIPRLSSTLPCKSKISKWGFLERERERMRREIVWYLERGWRRVGSKWSFQPQSMRKLKLSMETKYESGFSLYTPHSGVTCTEVPISLSLSL